MKKKFIIAGALSSLLLAAVCLLPWRARVNEKMYGIVAKESGEAIGEVEFTITGWKLDYLFRSDKLKVDIGFLPPPNASADFKKFLVYAETSGPLYPFSDSFYLTSYMAYQTAEQQLIGGYFALTADHDHCILTNVSEANDYIVGSTASDFDSDAILDLFERRLP